MSRPKSIAFVGFKVPGELKADALEVARHGGVTEAEVWKAAMEFRLTILRGLQLDYYSLRDVLPLRQVQSRLTKTEKV